MDINHGINVTQNATAAVANAVETSSGIAFVIGAVPFGDDATGTAGTPVLCTKWSEAVEAMGYDDDWATYPACEAMYAFFKVFKVQPVIFCPLAENDADAAVTALNTIELAISKFGIIPDLILIPGLSDQKEVAAAMATKAEAIDGMFKGLAVVDVDADTYTDAISAKENAEFNEYEVVCWPYGKSGNYIFHASVLAAAQMAKTDTDNGGIPYESPSNKSIGIDTICKSDGTEILLSHAQANELNEAGIVTLLNFIGDITIWGNYTAAYPEADDVKDIFIPVARMFGWVTNSIIRRFWSKLDAPMTRRLIDTIVDQCNIWLNGLVGSDYLLGARCEYLDDENSLEKLMNGIVKFHVYMTPPCPAQEVDFVLEYDAQYVTDAFSD